MSITALRPYQRMEPNGLHDLTLELKNVRFAR